MVYPWKLAYLRVPKAANTSVKTAIAEALKLKSNSHKPTKDDFWRTVDPERVGLVSPREFATNSRFEDFLSFTVVREPKSRLISCYKNKIVRNRKLTKSFERLGFLEGMSFENFVRVACQLSDIRTDAHIQSQSSMLTYRGKLLPDYVVKMEALSEGWESIRKSVREHAGVKLKSLKVRNKTAGVDATTSLTPELEALVHRRYSDDFQRFYGSKP